MSFSRATVGATLLAGASSALAAEPEWGLSLARSFDTHETDIVKLTYRRPLTPREGARWWPQQLQLGASVWRVPDLGGVTRRFDVNVTPGWRAQTAFRGGAEGYVEAGARPFSPFGHPPPPTQPPAPPPAIVLPL